MRVVYDNVHGGSGVTDTFANMLCVMGENGRRSLSSEFQRGRLRWVSLAWSRRYWPRWLGEFQVEEVKPLIVKWAKRCPRKNGFIYVMYRHQFEWVKGVDGKKHLSPYLISILYVPHIHQELWDAGPHFTKTPPVEGWPKQIRC